MRNQKLLFKRLLIVMLILSMKTSVMGQVITRVLSPDDQIENYIPWYDSEENIPIAETPLVDVQAVLEQDRITGREFPRISIKQNIIVSTKDGNLVDRGNYSVWNVSLYSKDAKSISVRFDDTDLPSDAVMFLYNEETSFVIGPITSKDFIKGTFISDYCGGDLLSIVAFVPNKIDDAVKIKISSLYHGLMDYEMFDNDFQASSNCNANIACEPGWDCQKESVCKILIDEGSCSGALVNNDCCDLTPYILTAEHCFSIPDFDPIDWRFRFNYESPDCDPTTETLPSQWITYFGANIVASWDRFSGTDFLLLELNQNIRPEIGINFSGWDRTAIPNHNIVTCVHHPAGDVKKISIDNEAPTDQAFDWFVDDWDTGTTEGGSSGSPLFDINQRIIGIDSRGDGFTPCDPNKGTFFGRFDVSWEGNGSNTGRLQDWLGASANPNTMDCMAHPFVEGPDLLCSSETFTLVENMPCTKQITWDVTPGNLFSSPTSGTGVNAPLISHSYRAGRATLTYTLSSEGCNESTVEHDFYVGSGFNFYYDNTLCERELGHAFLDPLLPPNSISNVVWTFSGAITGSGGSNFAKYRGRRSGYGDICVTYWDGCNIIDKCYGVYVRNCTGGEGPRSLNDVEPTNSNLSGSPLIQPNPFYGGFEIIIPQSSKSIEMTHIIRNSSGQIIRRITSKSQFIQVDLSEQPIGIYFIESSDGINAYNQKLIKW